MKLPMRFLLALAILALAATPVQAMFHNGAQRAKLFDQVEQQLTATGLATDATLTADLAVLRSVTDNSSFTAEHATMLTALTTALMAKGVDVSQLEAAQGCLGNMVGKGMTCDGASLATTTTATAIASNTLAMGLLAFLAAGLLISLAVAWFYRRQGVGRQAAA